MASSDLMKLFNEWHSMIEESKKKLGFSEADATDDDATDNTAAVAQADGTGSKADLEKEKTEVELEIEKESKRLEEKAAREARSKRQKSVVMALDSGESNAYHRPDKPLPKISQAKARWKRAVSTANAAFYLQKYSKKDDEATARNLEARLGGHKFGEGAFSELMWKHRLAVEYKMK